MGSGMMMSECEHCDGVGKRAVNEVREVEQFNQTEVYKESVAEIMKEHSLDEASAKSLLDNAINKVKPKRGRPKRV